MITQKGLGVLNTIQRFIFGAGLTFNMLMAAYYTQKGLMSTGDIIMIQTLMMQLLNPLFFLGSMYRGFSDSFIDVK
jgi:ABC-type transport system involved in Fe-S cluster assembly fused permease/ATPase subunit